WSYKQQGDIILRENVQPREVKPALLPSDLLELLSHPNSSVRKVGIQDLISLLNGKHLGLARGAEEKLREIAENDDSFSFRRTASEALTARGLIVETPMPVEIPKEKQKEEKHALTTERRVEGNIEKPISVPPREIHAPRVDRLREKTPRVLPDWKSIASRFNLRVILGIGALLVVVSLGIAVFPALKNMIAPEIGSTRIGKDGMTLLYVPAGDFTMGSNDGSLEEQPVHIVDLDAFWIDQTEVTNAMYARCVVDGVCEEPADKKSWTRFSYYDDPEFDNYPVISVDWTMAKTYCEWVDRRLPTEAEWEKAARGENANMYPWGNEFPNNGLLNYNSVIGDTTEVGKYPDGASVYGALDMAGNVWEWVSSLKQPYPYDAADGRENLDASDAARVLRGGTWRDGDGYARSASRVGASPTSTFNYAGFRCAVSEDEQVGSTPVAQSATDTAQPIATHTSTPTETSVPPTPTPGTGSTMTGKDGMTLLYVPAGEFTMGSEDGSTDEQPERTVPLDAFWIDKSEVTNKMYAACVEAGVCDEPTNSSSYTHSSYYGNSEFDDYPVIYVDWNMAKTYCEWADRRLPTEAEWEKAARGENANVYPWGNTFDGTLVNFCDTNCSFDWADKSSDDGFADVAPVGSYPNGASPYGAYDMAGNVWEWVSSLYQPYPYDGTDGREDLTSSDSRALRGGSWGSYVDNVRSAVRYRFVPTVTDVNVGFRCASSP
ncbi:MAG: formylglycine-generating enzyme family protein, partial [Anaerolineae bacterium]|nr:formylglycine-generating enzyme family protein [Anaerolineae bacterium]